MPIYAYRCQDCGFEKDQLQKISDAPLTVCPSCGGNGFARQLTAPAFQLKGSGWYVTDFRDGGRKNGAEGGAEKSGGDGASDGSKSSGTASGDGAAGKPDGGTSSGSTGAGASTGGGSVGSSSAGSAGASSSSGATPSPGAST